MTDDLFGLEQQPPRTNSRPEAAALVEVLKALRAHPAVAWCERMNTGAATVEGRFIRFGWRLAAASGGCCAAPAMDGHPKGRAKSLCRPEWKPAVPPSNPKHPEKR